MKDIYITTSWDDGHKLDLRLARLLQKYNLKGTFYISPEDREFMPGDRLSNHEIKRLSKDFEIGAHTMTHPRLTHIDSNTAKQEIIASKKYLEQVVGDSINSFCYPGGAYGIEHVKMVKNAGFYYARTVRRFAFGMSKNQFESATSVHAYKHLSDIVKILKFAKFHPAKFMYFMKNWDELAKAMFDRVVQGGGVFHLWGHSWEIDANDDWVRLEEVFHYISGKPELKYVTNEELVCPPKRKSSS